MKMVPRLWFFELQNHVPSSLPPWRSGQGAPTAFSQTSEKLIAKW